MTRNSSNIDLLKGLRQLRHTEGAFLPLAVTMSTGIFLPVTARFGFHALPSHFQFSMPDDVFGRFRSQRGGELWKTFWPLAASAKRCCKIKTGFYETSQLDSPCDVTEHTKFF